MHVGQVPDPPAPRWHFNKHWLQQGYTGTTMRNMGVFRSWLALGALAMTLLAPGLARAQYAAMVAVDPSAADRGIATVYGDLAGSLSKALKLPVRVDRSTNFADVLRSTRTGEYDVYVVPVQVAASGMGHGYVVLADTGQQDRFVLVTRGDIDAVAKLKGARLYLPQQDSLYAYLAKGMLNEAGLSLRELGKVEYQKTAGAGLVALDIGMSDATVTRQAEYAAWPGSKSGKFKVLMESQSVPSGVALLVKKSMPAELQSRLVQWVESGASGVPGLRTSVDLAGYSYVAGLGHFTPAQLPGVERVTAQQAAQLQKGGAVVVDVRSAKEYKARHIAGAVLAPYIEKSPKDVSFDAKEDDFSAVDKLDKSKPTIFACNGAECWKSFKASKVAAAKGFSKVYWLRGGLPEWDEKGLPVEASD